MQVMDLEVLIYLVICCVAHWAHWRSDILIPWKETGTEKLVLIQRRPHDNRYSERQICIFAYKIVFLVQ